MLGLEQNRERGLPVNKTILALLLAAGVSTSAIGGKTAPDGAEIHIDLPGSQHRSNISSRGQGCCTQTSLHHSAVWQDVPALKEFHEWVKSKGLPGGSYPQEMDKRIAMIAKDRNLPPVKYLNLQGGRELLPILRAACEAGLMPGVTYSRDPEGKRYGGQTIAHMVSLVHMDDKYACILDNNYIGEDKYQWLTIDQFVSTWTGGRAGWAVIILDGCPPSFLPWN